MSDFFSRRACFYHVGGPRRPNNIVRAALVEEGAAAYVFIFNGF